MKILCIIPARKNSKGIKNKNLKKINGKSLLEITIDLSKKIKSFNKIFVSTDSRLMQNISLKKKVECPILRPKKLSGDKTPMKLVILHVLKYLQINENYKPDAVAILQPTSPLRTTQTVKSACRIFIKKNADSLATVEKIKHTHHPSKLVENKFRKNFLLMKDFKYKSKATRQSEKIYFGLDGGVIFLTKSKLIKKDIITGKTILLAVSKKESVDIDSLEDLEICRKLFK
jgi:CMP-N,N'-diacetyllegionaminic acid synthase